MKKKILVGIAIVVIIVGGVMFLGYFPVARVNGQTVWYYTYKENADALQRYNEKNRQSQGSNALTPEQIAQGREQVLQNLIGNIVIRNYIKAHYSLDDLSKEASDLTNNALKSKDVDPAVLSKATVELYGWSVEDFKKNVLFPQALQEVLQQHIEKDNQNYAEIILAELKNAHVQTFLVPWKWQDGKLVNK